MNDTDASVVPVWTLSTSEATTPFQRWLTRAPSHPNA